MESKPLPKIVAIDGPAGSGKSTIASLVSRKLGWDYLNTGTLYRLIGFLAKQNKVALSAEQELSELITNCAPAIQWREGIFYYKGSNISMDLQNEDIGQLASDVAKSKLVRSLLLPIQRNLALSAQKGVIIDGRDIGTVVFPNADLKIFMTADLKARAQRRLKQIPQQKSTPLPSLQEITDDLRRRDEQDAQRAIAPLQKAVDAIEFDTSVSSLEDCVASLVNLICERLSA